MFNAVSRVLYKHAEKIIGLVVVGSGFVVVAVALLAIGAATGIAVFTTLAGLVLVATAMGLGVFVLVGLVLMFIEMTMNIEY